MKKYVFLPLLSFLSFLTINLPAQDWIIGGNTLGANGTLGTNSSHSLLFETSNTPRGILTNTGIWHFGATTVPAVGKVQITHNSASGNPQLMLYEPANDYVRLYFKNTNTASYFGIAASPASTTAASKLNFLYSPVGDIMTILGNKRVGIGTTNPATTLHVVGNSLFTDVLTVSVGGISATSTASTGNGILGIGHYGVYGSGKSIGVYGTASNATGYGLSGNGFIGVYATSNVASGDGVRTNAYAASAYGVNAYSSLSFGVYGSTGNSSSYAGYFAGNVYSSGSYLPSDRELKENITDLSIAMDMINKLQPKIYEYKQEGSYRLMNLPQGKHYGLIAQEVEAVLPGLIKETQFNAAKAPEGESSNAATIRFKAINYTELLPILVKGIQEVNQKTEEIEKLKLQVDAQQQQINELKEMVSKLAIGQRGNVNISAAYLEGSAPNPTISSTLVRYHIPSNAIYAKIIITDMKGAVLKSIGLNKGSNQIRINTQNMAAGTYNYTLYVDGQQADSKQMMVGR